MKDEVEGLAYLQHTSACEHAGVQATIDELFQVSFEALSKVLEHRGATRQYDVLRG
jgi:hypothetical protein